MNCRAFLFLALITLAGALWLPSESRAQGSRAAQEDDIREAVVRYQIAKWDLRAEVFFLEIQFKDPTDLLRRFADNPKPVRKKSLSRKQKDIVGWVVEKKTKKVGVIFDQEKIKWNSESIVEVEGGYYCVSLCMAGGIYHVERKADRWVVTEFKVSSIS